MIRFDVTALAAILVSGATGCLLYTDSINVAPTVTITAPDAILRGQPAMFQAVARDANQAADTLAYAWGTGDGACPDEAKAAGKIVATTGPAFAVTPTQANATFCVWVFVTDSDGARAFATSPLASRNLPPTPMIQLVSPVAGTTYELYSQFRVSAAGSRGLDSLSYRWGVTRPDGTILVPSTCADPTDAQSEICFAAGVPGTFRVDLWAKDSIEESQQPATTVLTVEPDRPPCIRATTPDFVLPQIIQNPLEDLAFQVLHVDDDGDPIPAPDGQAASGSHFVWSWREGTSGTFQRAAGFRGATFSFRGKTFRTGDLVQLRAEYQDRVRPERDLESCRSHDVGRCESKPASGCYQWVTWTVQYL